MKFIRVPSLAENIDSATLSKWLVKIGDNIIPGMNIAECITEKADFELYAENDLEGILLCMTAKEKSTLPVGYVIGVVDCVDENDFESLAEKAKDLAEKENRKIENIINATAGQVGQGGSGDKEKINFKRPEKIRATPAARRLAKESGIELGDVFTALNIKGAVKEEHIKQYLAGNS
jgi:pyruvate dehydrogenase E2 component (dihydrolipoamide acetyltransferase)